MNQSRADPAPADAPPRNGRWLSPAGIKRNGWVRVQIAALALPFASTRPRLHNHRLGNGYAKTMTANHPPLGPAGALRIAYELIDAQAAHIKNLERGHWSRETRALVEDKRDELETAQRAEEAGSCCAAGACQPCEQDIIDVESPTIDDLLQGNTPEECPHGFHPTSCGMCTGPAAAYGPPCSNLDCPLPYAHSGPCAPVWLLAQETGPAAAYGPTGCSTGDHHHDEPAPPPGMVTYPYDKGGELPTPAADYINAIAKLQLAAAQAPKEHTGTHPEGAWPPFGQCPRCDDLQPLWDKEQEALRVLRPGWNEPAPDQP